MGDIRAASCRSRASSSTSTGSTNFGVTDSPQFATDDDTTDATAAVALVIGLVFLGVGAVLDRKRYEGAATPFVAVGAFEAIVGAIVLGGNDSALLGGLLAIGAGAVVGSSPDGGDRRRATTWIGVLADLRRVRGGDRRHRAEQRGRRRRDRLRFASSSARWRSGSRPCSASPTTASSRCRHRRHLPAAIRDHHVVPDAAAA